MAEETGKTSIKQLIQDMTEAGVGILQGVVKSASPLKIQIVNDDKLTISSNITYVPQHLTDYTVTVDIAVGSGSLTGNTTEAGDSEMNYNGKTDEAGEPEHTHTFGVEMQNKAHTHDLSSMNIIGATMTVHNALKVGDMVHIISFNHGKQYFVLDRVA